MTIAAPAIAEEKGFEYLIPPGVPYLLAAGDFQQERPAKAAAILADWMKNGIAPAPQIITLPPHTDYQLFL